MIGAPIIAVAIGVLITNAIPDVSQTGALRIGDVSKLCLKGGIVLLGAICVAPENYALAGLWGAGRHREWRRPAK